MSSLVVSPARSLRGGLTLPGDKSISHRALLTGAISHGITRITHCLHSGDIQSTVGALEALGVPISLEGDTLVVQGSPNQILQSPRAPLDMGNSGTTARLLLGILAGQPFETTLVGDASLSKRPMRRVTEPLEKMGAAFLGTGEKDHLPLTIRGGGLRGIRYELPVPSAQVKSALLLAGLYAQGVTTVVESVATRDHTERILRLFGANLQIAASTESGLAMTVHPNGPLKGRELAIPGDISSASFFLVAAAIVPNASVTVKDVGLNPTRTGLLDTLKGMGAKIDVMARPEGPKQSRNDAELWEPRGDVTVCSSSLTGVTVPPEEIPRLIDELPILMVAATQAQGVTRIQGAGELKFKETDRILSMVTGLKKMGAQIHPEGDSIVIEGTVRLKGTQVSSFGDHRTAMALAIAGLVAEGPTTLEEAQWIDISLPDFAQTLESLQK